MAFNGFSFNVLVRVVFLALVLMGFSLALITPGYHATTLLLVLFSLGQLHELTRYVSQTNLELVRFLESARHGDVGQRFSFKPKSRDFTKLADTFGEIMNDFHLQRREQEEKFRYLKMLTDHVPVPVMSLYPDARIKLHNNAARRLLGEGDWQHLSQLSVFGENFVDHLRHLKPGHPQLLHFNQDGANRQLTVNATQIITGPASELLISLQDIQTELDGMQWQAWEELVRVLTHEIMNSITPVASLAKTASELVHDLNQQVETGPLQQELEDIQQAVDTVARRSDSLMQFVQNYRSLTFLPTPEKQSLSVKEFMEHLQKLMAPNFQQANIELSIQVDPDSLQLYGDADLMEQMLINLLKNAEQAVQETSKPRAIQLTGKLTHRGRVLIAVEDSGPGIPEEIQDKVFIPFFTTKHSGSGVGLALTRQIMLSHGGQVTIGQSTLGGAQFNLIF